MAISISCSTARSTSRCGMPHSNLRSIFGSRHTPCPTRHGNTSWSSTKDTSETSKRVTKTLHSPDCIDVIA